MLSLLFALFDIFLLLLLLLLFPHLLHKKVKRSTFWSSEPDHVGAFVK
jgi:hypothetical protein